MAENKQVQKDIEASKKKNSKHINNVAMFEDKIKASYSMDRKDTEGNYEYINYEKLFDSWEDFNDYAELFFK